jgi:hypothetical protein
MIIILRHGPPVFLIREGTNSITLPSPNQIIPNDDNNIETRSTGISDKRGDEPANNTITQPKIIPNIE